MKKLLGIVVLGLLWCNVGFAGCTDDLDTTFEWLDLGMTRVNKDDRPSWAYFTWKNKTDKKIRITRIFLETADKKIVIEKKFKDYFIHPFRIGDWMIQITGINLDVVDSPVFECRYDK